MSLLCLCGDDRVVANISLMALGTSSPEITLAIVESILTLNKPAGELGPSCIVGSAAYNLLMITAVSTTALPGGTFKKISQLRVFATTCVWSLWAYVWMLVVYRW
jgi:solute carrier family 8 (sodium/calcium exchanger)